jgi:hypothetical protein
MIATRLRDTLIQLARAEICLTDAIGTEVNGRGDQMTEHETRTSEVSGGA